MEINELILFTVSALPVFLLGRYIYKKDRDKEPKKLLIKLFLGGIFSCFLTLILSSISTSILPILEFSEEKNNLLLLVIQVFIGVALIEEFSKWIFVYTISYKDENFDQLYDMILYGAFVALGFAFFENLLYVYEGGVVVGLLRAILAVPGHVCDGIFMGYYLGLAKISSINNNKTLTIKNIILSILVPTILHGIYDYCLFTDKFIFIIIFLVFVVILFKKTLKKVDKISKINKNIKYKDNFCTICGRKVDSNFCPNCGRRNV